MLFNSISFAIFLPVVFFLYWFLAKQRWSQNIVLFFSSYVFYGFWDWRFLFLLIFSTLLDYFSAIQIETANKTSTRRFWFCLSIIINISFLGVFKYFNFFSESFSQLLNGIGFHVDPWLINVILPVGISFYTFHGLSYIIDVYQNRIKAEQNFIDYSVFVCFFPLLVAGPIERATHLLPQIKQMRRFDYHQAVDGL
jgi:D-alanyl-lipoteichoic acid acyltransferase DltB (MBOAT superfamily)